jgi:hypothetical protein
MIRGARLPHHLSLNPIQRYMWLDDRPQYPMTFLVRVHLSGCLRREPFVEALEAMVARHVLARSTIASINGSWQYVPGDDRPRVDWAEWDSPVRCAPGEEMDLRREPGLRIWVRVRPEQACVTLLFHHSPFDGIAAYRLVGDLLVHYALITAGTDAAVELWPLSEGRLTSQTDEYFGDIGPEERDRIVSADFGGRNVELAAPNGPLEATEPPSIPRYVLRTVPRPCLDALRTAAQEVGATTNDLLLASSFQTVVDWNEPRHAVRRNHLISVTFPADLRGERGYDLPATNLTANLYLRRRRAEVARDGQFLRGIALETARHKAEGYRRFGDLLRCLQRDPGPFEDWPASDRCLASIAVSNVGDPSRRFAATFPRSAGLPRFGSLLLAGIDGIAPLRPRLRAAISTFTYRRELVLCFRCDHHCFRPPDVESFADLYCRNLLAWAGHDLAAIANDRRQMAHGSTDPLGTQESVA